MRYARLAAIAMVGILLAGCSTPFGERLQAAFSIITTASAAQVDPQVIIVAANTFDALEVSAKNYLKLARCTGANGPICREPRATRPLVAAIRSGRTARINALAFLKSHPGQLGPSGLYDALSASISTLKTVMANFKIGGV